MKVYRILYWTVMVCSLFWGLYSGSRFSWLLFLVLALVLLAALGVNLWTACSFSYIQELSASQGEKGQTAHLHIGIYNDKPFPFTRMRVAVETPDPAEVQTLAIDLAPKASCSFDLRLSLPRRGEFLVGMTRLDLQDVFGLLPMHFDLRRLPYYRQKPLLVLPRVRELALPAGGRPENPGTGLAGYGAGQEEFASLRNWAPGDRLSRVHWAASAKTGTLFTRQYEDPAGGSALVFLDCRTLGDEGADLLAECAATLLFAHLSRGEPVSLWCGSQPPERAFSLAEFPRLREHLALLRFDEGVSPIESLEGALAHSQLCRVYLLGGRFDAKLFSALSGAASWRYWTAEPLPGDGYPKRAAAIGQTDVAAFLQEHGEEEP